MSWSATAAQETLSATTGRTVTFYMFLEGASIYDGMLIGHLGWVFEYSHDPGMRSYALAADGTILRPSGPVATGDRDTLVAYMACPVTLHSPTLLMTGTFTVPEGPSPLTIMLRDDDAGWRTTVSLCPDCGNCFIDDNEHNSLVLQPTAVSTASTNWGAIKSRFR